MHPIDLIGCIASGLVLLTFYVNDMISLRTAALCSNVAFIIYAASLHLMPILLLHSILIPINLWRMTSALCTNDRCGMAEVPWKALSRLVNLVVRRREGRRKASLLTDEMSVARHFSKWMPVRMKKTCQNNK